MDMITVQQAAEKWKVTPRRIQGLCKEGKIKGALRWGRNWMIPSNAIYPYHKEEIQVLPIKSPSLLTSNLYNSAGSADALVESLHDYPSAQMIIKAELAYNRFEFDKLHEYANLLLHHHYGFYTTIAAGVQLCLSAAYSGDLKLFLESRRYIFEAECKNDEERDIVSLWLSIVDFILGDINLPQWFQKGKFEHLPSDIYPVVKFQYAKFKWFQILKMLLSNDSKIKEEGKVLLKALPNLLEPMISQAKFDKTLLSEIGLRLICAIVYHDLGNDTDAIYHLDIAIQLSLPDHLYGLLIECSEMLDTLLYERLKIISNETVKTIKLYEKKMIEAQIKLRNDLNSLKQYNLSIREREASKLAAFGMSNDHIAERMHISENSVRSLLSMAMNKTGAKNRKELGLYL